MTATKKRKRRPAPRIVGPLSDAAHAAIAAELVRLSLCGKPERPELATSP